MRSLFCALLCMAAFSGCVKDIAVSTVGGIVDDGFEAFTEEQDLVFAEQALPGNIKLLEVMLKNDSTNVRLLRLASEGYSSYALAFLEDTEPARARAFYLRGRDYGMRILRQDAEWARALDGSLDDLHSLLARRSADDVPAVFWTAFGWGSSIYLNLTSPDAIADLPKTEAMMEFVVRHDSAYYYAGAHLFLGTLAGSRPKMLGGDTVKARMHFESALRINQGRFLMTYVYYARSVAVQRMDERLFDSLLVKVDEASLEILPKARLANAVAKKKAQILRSKKSDIF
jgi:TRAP transporter T-component